MSSEAHSGDALMNVDASSEAITSLVAKLLFFSPPICEHPAGPKWVVFLVFLDQCLSHFLMMQHFNTVLHFVVIPNPKIIFIATS